MLVIINKDIPYTNITKNDNIINYDSKDYVTYYKTYNDYNELNNDDIIFDNNIHKETEKMYRKNLLLNNKIVYDKKDKKFYYDNNNNTKSFISIQYGFNKHIILPLPLVKPEIKNENNIIVVHSNEYNKKIELDGNKDLSSFFYVNNNIVYMIKYMLSFYKIDDNDVKGIIIYDIYKKYGTYYYFNIDTDVQYDNIYYYDTISLIYFTLDMLDPVIISKVINKTIVNNIFKSFILFKNISNILSKTIIINKKTMIKIYENIMCEEILYFIIKTIKEGDTSNIITYIFILILILTKKKIINNMIDDKIDIKLLFNYNRNNKRFIKFDILDLKSPFNLHFIQINQGISSSHTYIPVSDLNEIIKNIHNIGDENIGSDDVDAYDDIEYIELFKKSESMNYEFDININANNISEFPKELELFIEQYKLADSISMAACIYLKKFKKYGTFFWDAFILSVYSWFVNKEKYEKIKPNNNIIWLEKIYTVIISNGITLNIHCFFSEKLGIINFNFDIILNPFAIFSFITFKNDKDIIKYFYGNNNYITYIENIIENINFIIKIESYLGSQEIEKIKDDRKTFRSQFKATLKNIKLD